MGIFGTVRRNFSLLHQFRNARKNAISRFKAKADALQAGIGFLGISPERRRLLYLENNRLTRGLRGHASPLPTMPEFHVVDFSGRSFPQTPFAHIRSLSHPDSSVKKKWLRIGCSILTRLKVFAGIRATTSTPIPPLRTLPQQPLAGLLLCRRTLCRERIPCPAS